MKCAFNCVLVIIGLFLCFGYYLAEHEILFSTTKDEVATLGTAAVFGAILISLGILNLFTTFYIVEKSKK